MSKRDEEDLTSDLIGLLRQYGPDVFTQVAQKLASPRLVEQLLSLLKDTASATRETSGVERIVAGPRPGKTALTAAILAVQHYDPEKAEQIRDLWDDLLEKRLQTPTREIMMFVGLDTSAQVATLSRQDAIQRLIERFLSLPLEEVRERILKIRMHDPQNNTLEKWADLILNPDYRQKRAQ